MPVGRSRRRHIPLFLTLSLVAALAPVAAMPASFADDHEPFVVALFDFEGDTASPAVVHPDFEVSDMSAFRGAGTFVVGNPGRAMTRNQWHENDNYFEFTVTPPAAGIYITELSFDEAASGTGPTNWTITIVDDLDGSPTESTLTSGAVTGTSTPLSFSTHAADLTTAGQRTEPFSIRIRGFDASGNTGTWRIDNVTLTGLEGDFEPPPPPEPFVVALFDFDDGTTAPSQVHPDFAVTSMSVVKGSVSFPQGNPSSGLSLSSTQWDLDDNYFEFTVTPPATGVYLTGFAFDDRASGTGPTEWAVSIVDDLDGTPTETTIDTGAAHGSFATNTVDLTGLDQRTEPFSIRIYGLTASGGGGTWRIDNVTLTGLEGDFEPPPPPVCNVPPLVSPISMVQGPGDSTPCEGELVTIEGVVVGDYQGPSPNLRGFYVQSRDDDWDDDPLTSEGIFVFNFDNTDVALGDLVRVTGVAAEFEGQTQLNFPESVEILDTGWTVTITDVYLPFSDADYLERYEGMLVRFPEKLFVTEFFQLGRFGQIVVSSDNRLAQPTNVVDPGPDANALQAANDLNRIIFDDHYNIQNPDPILFGRGGNELTAENTLRGGDTVEGAVGVLTYGWGGQAASPNAYRLRIVGDPAMVLDPEYPGSLPGDFEDVVPVFQPTNPRPEGPPAVGGTVRVANFNVLNYFLTLDVFGSPNRNTACGPEGHKQACRGANTVEEFERQRTKLLQALIKLDADVVGLIELENSQDVEPLADIVEGLNDLLGAGTYAYVETGTVGTDVIKTGYIYKPGVVSTIGDFAVLDTSVDPRFDDTRNRPALAQSFVEDATGEVFTVVVNHFKSKGSCPSSGPDSDQRDGQGCWNANRTDAAKAMVDWLLTYPTGIVDDDVLVTGDLNAYAMEDPIRVFLEAGYTNLNLAFGGVDAYSYVFDGQWGYLDHALASPSMFTQVTGAAEYHINADEPSVLDYNTDFKTENHVEILYAPDEFRTSDHDPVLIGLCLGFHPVTAASPDMLWPPNHQYRSVTVVSTRCGEPIDVEIVEVTSSEPDSGLGEDDVADDIVITGDSTVNLRAERFSTAGRTYTITAIVSWLDDSEIAIVTVHVPHNMGQRVGLT